MAPVWQYSGTSALSHSAKKNISSPINLVPLPISINICPSGATGLTFSTTLRCIRINPNPAASTLISLFSGNGCTLVKPKPPSLSLTKLKKFIVPNVNSDLQNKFVTKYKKATDLQKEFLDTINECKALFYSKLNLKKEVIKKDISFKTSLKELKENKSWTPISFDPYGEKVLTFISKKFKLEDLKKHIDLFKGEEIGSANYLDYLSKNKDSIPFLRTSDIFNYELDSYPDFYCDKSFKADLKQEINAYDIAFTKDGSIGNLALVTKEDNCILSSGHAILRIKESSTLNPFYIFLALSLKEIGQYQANKRTVIASTIPHLRPQNIYKIKIPILDTESIKAISEKVEYAFGLIEEKKRLIKTIKKEMNELMKEIK